MAKKQSPFYCYKRNCRKTAWDTPEYMTPEDWATLKQFRDAIVSKNLDAFMALTDNREAWSAFFNRMIGWPEGAVCCQDSVFARRTFFPMVSNHMLPKIEQVLQSH